MRASRTPPKPWASTTPGRRSPPAPAPPAGRKSHAAHVSQPERNETSDRSIASASGGGRARAALDRAGQALGAAEEQRGGERRRALHVVRLALEHAHRDLE